MMVWPTLILQGITRALAGQSRTVRLPAHIHNRLGVINKAAQALTMDRKPISVKVCLEVYSLFQKLCS